MEALGIGLCLLMYGFVGLFVAASYVATWGVVTDRSRSRTIRSATIVALLWPITIAFVLAGLIAHTVILPVNPPRVAAGVVPQQREKKGEIKSLL